MARVQREVPAVTWVEECDFENVPMDQLVATAVLACARTLVEFPELNARLEGDEIVYLDRYDIGVAVQTDHGLVVPVVRGADSKTAEEIHGELGRLAASARAGKLEPGEVRDSTFTITSAGKLAGLFQTPLINHPEVAILSIGRIEPRAVVRDGEIVVRKTGAIAISFDHRVVDGARAAEFGLAVISRLETPAALRRKSSQVNLRSKAGGMRPRIVGVVFVLGLAGVGAGVASRPQRSSSRTPR